MCQKEVRGQKTKQVFNILGALEVTTSGLRIATRKPWQKLYTVEPSNCIGLSCPLMCKFFQ